jgi:hypothetical protein
LAILAGRVCTSSPGTVTGSLPLSPIKMATSVPWPLPVSAREPYKWAHTRAVRGNRPLCWRSRAKSPAARYGPKEWELEGPIPIFSISKTLIFSMGANGFITGKIRGSMETSL